MQVSLSSQQDQLAAIKGAVTTNLIAVCKSLGGGWDIRKGSEPAALIPDHTREEMLERTGYWDKTFADTTSEDAEGASG